MYVFIPLFADSKTPTSKFSKSKEVRWEINSPIRLTNNQWGMKKTPLIKVSLYDKIKRKNDINGGEAVRGGVVF
ncbi:hypothetical protein CN354_09855 [Bacillus cereus]|nr:hypothetical protein CN354_09855 [Bacillus cereus]